MKKILYFCVMLMLLCATAFNVSAVSSVEDLVDTDSLYDALSDDAAEFLSELGVDSVESAGMFDVSFENLFSAVKSVFIQNIKAPLGLFAKLTGVLLLLALLKNLVPDNTAADLFTLLICILISISGVRECVSAVVSAIEITSKFVLAFVPAFAVILAVSGSTASALTYNTAVMGCSQVISACCNSVFLPLTSVFLSVSIAFCLNSSVNANRLVNAMNKVIFFFLSLSMSIYTAVLSFKNVMDVSINNVASKSVRFVVSSFIPVVGSAISEAYSTVMGSFSLIKGSVALFGILAVFAVSLPVLMQIALFSVCFNTASFVAESLDMGGAGTLFGCMSCTLKIVAVLLVLEMFLLVISTGIVIVSGGGVS